MYRRRNNYIPRPLRYQNKYQLATTIFADDIGWQPNTMGPKLVTGIITPVANNQGSRKVKNFTVSVAVMPNADAINNFNGAILPNFLFFGLIYLPNNMQININQFDVNNVILYEPSAYVICSRVLSFTSGDPVLIENNLSRVLNEGDSIIWFMFSRGPQNPVQNVPEINVAGTCRYSICYK